MPRVSVPRPDRLRRICGSFAWTDHRFIRDGHMEKLTRDEIALYTFLVLVGDRNGVSYYRLEKICRYLDEMDWGDFHCARDGLIEANLIDFRPFNIHDPNGFYQVLGLEPRAPGKVE